MPQTAAGNLGTQLGELLFGRPGASSDKAYYEGQALGSLTNDRMMSARKARAAAMIDEDRLSARQGVRPTAAQAAGYSEGAAPFITSVLRSNDNVDLRDLGKLAVPQAAQAFADAADATKLGDMATANRYLALAQGKPLETTKIAEGQVYNPYDAPGQDVALTALGDAAMADKRASAGEHAAHSRLYDTQTAAGGYNPRTGRAGAGKITYPTAPDATAYLGDPDNASAFTAWRSQHPDLRDGNEAWIEFRASRPIGAPTGKPGTDGGAAPVYDAPGAIDLAHLGEQMVAAAPQAAAPAPTPKVGSSPYPEGTRLRGPGGKVYEVRGGMPVEVP